MEESFQIFRLADEMHLDKMHRADRLETYLACKNFLKLQIGRDRSQFPTVVPIMESAIYNEEIFIRCIVSQPFKSDTICWMMVRFEYDGSICGLAVNAEKFYNLERLFQEIT